MTTGSCRWDEWRGPPTSSTVLWHTGRCLGKEAAFQSCSRFLDSSIPRFRSIACGGHCLTCATILRLNGSDTVIRNFLNHSLSRIVRWRPRANNQYAQLAESVIKVMELCNLVAAKMQTNGGGETNTRCDSSSDSLLLMELQTHTYLSYSLSLY